MAVKRSLLNPVEKLLRLHKVLKENENLVDFLMKPYAEAELIIKNFRAHPVLGML